MQRDSQAKLNEIAGALNERPGKTLSYKAVFITECSLGSMHHDAKGFSIFHVSWRFQLSAAASARDAPIANEATANPSCTS